MHMHSGDFRLIQSRCAFQRAWQMFETEVSTMRAHCEISRTAEQQSLLRLIVVHVDMLDCELVSSQNTEYGTVTQIVSMHRRCVAHQWSVVCRDIPQKGCVWVSPNHSRAHFGAA